MIANTRAKAQVAGVANIELTRRDFVVDGSGLAESIVDYVYAVQYSHAEERMGLLREALRVLRPNGKLAIIHWNYDASTPRGPSMSIRPRPGECRAWAEEVGFVASISHDIDLPPYHYGVLLERGG